MPWDRVDEVRINALFSRWTCSDVQGAVMPDFTGVAQLTGTARHDLARDFFLAQALDPPLAFSLYSPLG